MKADHPELHIYLYRVRESLGWSLREAAERAGISFSRLGEIERGRDSHSGKPFVPSYVTLCRLAAAYGLPPAELLLRAGHKPGPELTPEEWRLLDGFRRLPDAARASLLTSLPQDEASQRVGQGSSSTGASLAGQPMSPEPEEL